MVLVLKRSFDFPIIRFSSALMGPGREIVLELKRIVGSGYGDEPTVVFDVTMPAGVSVSPESLTLAEGQALEFTGPAIGPGRKISVVPSAIDDVDPALDRLYDFLKRLPVVAAPIRDDPRRRAIHGELDNVAASVKNILTILDGGIYRLGAVDLSIDAPRDIGIVRGELGTYVEPPRRPEWKAAVAS